MVAIEALLLVQGPSFSPARVERLANVKFATSHAPGSPAICGRYAGGNYPFGRASLCEKWPTSPTSDSELGDVVRADLIEACRLEGATSIIVHLNVEYREQCNFELSERFLARLAEIRVPLTVTCFQGSPDP